MAVSRLYVSTLIAGMIITVGFHVSDSETRINLAYAKGVIQLALE